MFFARVYLSFFLVTGLPLFAEDAEKQENAVEVLSIGGTEYTVGSEAQHGEYNLEFKLETGSKPADLIFGYQDASRFYRLSVAEGQATLTRTLAGLQQQLAQATVSEFTSLTIRRRRLRLSILFGEDALLATGDGALHEGKIAIAISDEHRKLLKFRYQPVTDIYFADDFMRAQAEDTVWKTVSGDWKITSTIDKHLQSTFFKEDNFSRSSNPFIFEGDAKEDLALSVVGRSFWDEYDFKFSIRGSGGCAFFIQDASHYYGLEWKIESVFPVASELRLFCRDAELISELATAKLPGKLNQWYGVEVYAGTERIRVQIDGRKYIDVPHTRYSKGKAGLFVAKGGHAQFDDVLIKTPTAWDLAYSETLLRGKKIPVTGTSGTEKTKGATWQVIKKPDGAALQVRGEDAASVYWLGHSEWRANCFSTTVETKPENMSAGIMFDWRDAKTFMLAVKRNELVELIQIKDGQFKTLNSARLSTHREHGHPSVLTLDLADRTLARFYVDGNLELRTQLPLNVKGGAGLFATGPRINATFGGNRWHETISENIEILEDNEIFNKDVYMLDWSAPRGAWVEDKKQNGTRTFWHKGDFYGRVHLEIPVNSASKEGEKPKISRTLLYLRAETTSFFWGGHLLFLESSDGKARLGGRESGQIVKDVFFSPSADEPLKVECDGQYIVCSYQGKDLMTWRLKSRPAGTRLGIAFTGEPSFEKMRIERGHVIDNLFKSAPTDWNVVGRWEVTNKFACDPRWSYLAAESDGLAAAWHKNSFEGDITLEYYTGMRYRKEVNWSPYYPRPGDMNAVICGDGKNVFSGYTFVLAGWHTTTTRIFKNGKVVAETENVGVPSTRFQYPPLPTLHRRWFYVKIRKKGNKLYYYLDNKLILSWEDPNPLKQGKVGLWTQNNSIMVARVKTQYERTLRSKVDPELTATGSKELRMHAASKSHPGLYSDFANGSGGWANPSGDQGAAIAVVPRNGRNQCLEMTNINAGGDFAVSAPASGINLALGARLEFEYRIPPDVKTNLYLQLSGAVSPFESADRIAGKQWHFVQLTGSGDSNENLKSLGHIRDVQADGKWRHAEFDLYASLKKLYPSSSEINIEQLWFGNRHTGYIQAGLAGNQAGLRYWLDNFKIWSEGGQAGEIELTVNGSDGGKSAGLESVAHWFSNRPESVVQEGTNKVLFKADGTTDPEKRAVKFDSGKNGYFYLNMAGKLMNGKELPVTSFPLRIAAPSFVESIVPKAQSEWGGQPILIKSSGRTFPQTVQITVAGSAYSSAHQNVQADAAARQIRFSLPSNGHTFASGQRIPFKLNFGDEVIEWEYVWSYQKDKTVPTLVKLDQLLVDADFENDLEGWTRYGKQHGALLIRDRNNPGQGNYSLKLFNEQIGGSFGVTINASAFHGGMYPVLRFKYRIPEGTLIDLTPNASSWKRINLTDNNARNTHPRIGSVPNFQADGRWHQAEIDIAAMLASHVRFTSHFNISQMLFADWGWQGNPEGVEVWFDDFQIAPLLNRKKGIVLSWKAHDASGIKKYSYHWSKSGKDSADTNPEGVFNSKTFTSVPEGDAWFHIRAQDKAGNWGPNRSYRFIVDDTAPVLVETKPAAGEKSGDDKIRLVIDRKGGAALDPSTIALTVNGSQYLPNTAGINWDSKTGSLVWDWLKISPSQRVSVENGATFKVALGEVADFAENKLEGKEWEWTFDISKDKKSPRAPEVQASEDVFSFTSFSDTTSPCSASGSGARLSLHKDEILGQNVLKAESAFRSQLGAVLQSKGYELKDYPYLSFDYRFPKDFKTDLMVTIQSSRYVLRLTDSFIRRRYPQIGRAEVVCDNKWRHMDLDLFSYVKAVAPDQPSYPVKSVTLGDFGFDQNPAGTTFYLDNVAILGASNSSSRFEMSALDISGIQGYSFSISRNPYDKPDKRIDVQGNTLDTGQLAFGIWYLHTRACDKAGNWGPTSHLPVRMGGE